MSKDDKTVRNDNEKRAAFSNTASHRYNNEKLAAMIRDGQRENAIAKEGTLAHFMSKLNHAQRLWSAKVEEEIEADRFAEFARDLGINRTDANLMVRLHRHRDDILAWVTGEAKLAELRKLTFDAPTWRAALRRYEPTEPKPKRRATVAETVSDPLDVQVQKLKQERIAQEEAAETLAEKLRQAEASLAANERRRAEMFDIYEQVAAENQRLQTELATARGEPPEPTVAPDNPFRRDPAEIAAEPGVDGLEERPAENEANRPRNKRRAPRAPKPAEE